MIIFKTKTGLESHVSVVRNASKKIGFVPTMGALHQGHIQLLLESKQRCDLSVASIYVNPTQFNNKEDLIKYPVTTEADIDLLEKNGCDVLYLPSNDEIYPQKNESEIDHHIGRIEHILEGEFRPGHYKGVVEVVNILLSTVLPQVLFLGAKDYQQCAVLTPFVAKYFPDTEVVKVPTVRAVSGLALSSRNKRLSPAELEIAPIIFECLNTIKENLRKKSIEELINQARERLALNGLQPEYLVIADAENLETVTAWDKKSKIVALIAVHLGAVRLIDNVELN